MVPVDMDRHQKIYLWFRLLKWTDTKNQFSKKKHRHYVRKTHSKCAHMNNRDAQIARLHHCVLHYKVY
jgi:hypothetical protein